MTYTTTKLFCRIFMVTFKFNAQTETDNYDEFKRKPIISDSHRPDLNMHAVDLPTGRQKV